MRPVADNQEAAPRTSLSHYHHQDATTPDCHTQSPKPVCNTEDVTKTGPTEETELSAPSTSELIISQFHNPLPVVLKEPSHYPRDGTVLMNFGQSCINFLSYAPAVEVTTTGHVDGEPLLRLTIVPEQETLRS